MYRRRSTSWGQEITHQLFGCSRRPVRHMSKRLLRSSVYLTHSIVRDILGSVVGLGHSRRRRRR